MTFFRCSLEVKDFERLEERHAEALTREKTQYAQNIEVLGDRNKLQVELKST